MSKRPFSLVWKVILSKRGAVPKKWSRTFLILALPLSMYGASLQVHSVAAANSQAHHTPTPIPATETPVPPTQTPVPPTPTATASSSLFSDTFESDAVGSTPAGWSIYGTNAGFSVQQNGSHVYDHSGWTAVSIAGSTNWTNYSYSVSMLPNNWASEADGVLFRVRDSNNYYFLQYTGGTTLSVLKVVNSSSTTLASKALTMSVSSWHTIQVDVSGSSLTASVDGTKQLVVTDGTFATGAIGVGANSPVQFDTVAVTTGGPASTATPAPPTTSPIPSTATTTPVPPTITPTGTRPPATNTPVPSTPTPTPTKTTIAPTSTPTATGTSGGFPVTSATIKNKGGMNAEPSMRPWRYNGPNPDGWFCQVPNCYQSSNPLTMIDKEMQLMANLGVGVVRVEFPWPLIETSNGTYDWTRADYIVNEANKYSLQLQPILVYTPSWAASSTTISPSSTSMWSSFVKSVVGRYKNSVHYWELWNEPDGGHYWIDGDQKYTQNILIPGYSAAKSADSSATVLLGAPSSANATFLNDIYTYGGGNSFDVAGYHEYANVLSAGGIQGDVNTVQNVLNSHGQGSKRIWVGEYGYNESSNTTNDTNHVTAIKIMLQQVTGYQEAVGYNLRDDYSMTCCPASPAVTAYYGLVQHDDVTLKQGYQTMKTILGG
jgi:Laminin G domain